MALDSDIPSQNQVIAIIGATGVQGSSVLNSLLTTAHPIRAITRSASKLQPDTQLIVAETDINDIRSLEANLRGAWALFVNTFSDYSKPPGTEEELLKGIINAAVDAGVEYLVMSSLPEGMPARAYIEKSRAMQYARDIAKKSQLKPIFVQMGWYMSGFAGYMKPELNTTDNVVEFRWSTIDEHTKFPLVSASTDLGPVVKAIMENPDKWVDAEVPVVGDVRSIPEVSEIYYKVTGQPSRAVFVEHIPQEDIPSWTERHRGYKEVGYFPKFVGREEELPLLARDLNPAMRTFEDWLKETGFRV